MLYYIDENWYHFIKEYLEQFSKFVFQKTALLASDQADIFWTFYSSGQVLGYTTVANHIT